MKGKYNQPVESPERQFHDAIEAGDADALRCAFESHPEWKARIHEPLFSFDRPAIVNFAACAGPDILQVLLDMGADIHARSSWWAGGFGVLDHDNAAVVPFLIERGARVDAHAAARHNLLDRLREILDADPAAVHARGGDGQTPLHVAGSLEAAVLLVERGADIDARDIDHESTPAQYLIGKHPQTVRYLVSRGCETDLLLAAALGDNQLVERHLREKPATIRMRVDAEWFPMRDPRAGGSIYIWTLGQNLSAHRVARKFGHRDTFALLMDRSPEDLRLMEALLAGETELVSAMRSRDPEGVRELARQNAAYVSAAAQNNDTGAVRTMLECGWQVEGDGRHTPLHWAAWHGNVAMIQAILPFHPPLEFLDGEHNATPLGWAMHGSVFGWFRTTGDYAGAVRALLDAGAARPAEIYGSPAVQAALSV